MSVVPRIPMAIASVKKSVQVRDPFAWGFSCVDPLSGEADGDVDVFSGRTPLAGAVLPGDSAFAL